MKSNFKEIYNIWPRSLDFDPRPFSVEFVSKVHLDGGQYHSNNAVYSLIYLLPTLCKFSSWKHS